MLEEIDQLEAQACGDLEAEADAQQLEAFRIRYLGSKGAIKALMAHLKQVPAADKPAFGQKANALRVMIQRSYEQKKEVLAHRTDSRLVRGGRMDLTEPGTPSRLGREHVITQSIDQMLEVFGRMGFDVATGPEVEDEYHNFVALNIPPEHPARDPLENFYLSDPNGDNPWMLRSQTSTIQLRVMESAPPPVRLVAVGRGWLSVQQQVPMIVRSGLCAATAAIAPITAAAPPMSIFISFIPSNGLRFSPPVSKVMPLPTKWIVPRLSPLGRHVSRTIRGSSVDPALTPSIPPHRSLGPV